MFSDTKLKAGDRWKERIEQELARARVAVLLVSADFLASDFILENELPPLLHRAEREGTRIVPVIVKSCRFTRDPNLSGFQAINPPNEPLIDLTEGQQEAVYDQVSELVENLLD